MKVAIAILVVLIHVGLTHAQDKKELEKLAGKWQPVSSGTGTQKFPEEQLKKTLLVIEKDKYTVTIGPMKDQGELKLDPKAKPKTMDIFGTEGPNKGKTFLCIYEIDGDMLKVCYALDGTKRPTEFKPGDKALLTIYKRMKDDKKK